MFEYVSPSHTPAELSAAAAALDAVEDAQAIVEIDVLDADQTLVRVAAGQRRANLAEAEQLVLAAHWADLHAVLAATTPRRRGGQALVQPGGEGTPTVAEFCLAELAAMLGLSVGSAGFLVADALDLRHRLPLLWQQVQAGDVRIWVARRVAKRTRRLSPDAAARVDAKMAGLTLTLPFGRLEKVLDAAILTADPDLATEETAAAAAQQGVWVGRETDHGHGTLFAKAAVPAIAAVDVSLDTLARAMTVLGDTDSHDLRRAKALAILADPAAALELTRLAHEATAAGTTTGPHDGTDPRRIGDLGPATLYVHLSDRSLADAAAGNTDGAVARVDGVGPVLLQQAHEWLHHRHITVKPVIDIAGIPAVDKYEIPAVMAEAIRLRTPADCTPYSPNISGHGDSDHTRPYVPIDEGGPPGQTAVDNLGWMGRTNHRWKTHGRWNVSQPRSGTWLWRSPLGFHYLVDHAGTTPLGKLAA